MPWRSWTRPERPDVRWTTRPQWHVTLRFLGEVADPVPVVAALDAAPRRLRGHAGACGGRLGRGVVMVPVGGLEALAGEVAAATAAIGRPPERRPFAGHLTLARVRRGARCATWWASPSTCASRWSTCGWCTATRAGTAPATRTCTCGRLAPELSALDP